MSVRLTHVCDPCSEQGEENEGSQQTLSVDGLSGLLDLCELHRKELVEPLRLLLLEYGRTEDGKPVKPGRKLTPAVVSDPVPCLVEGCTKGPYANRNSMLAHLRMDHDTTEAELLGLADHVCTVRNCGRAFGSPQALAVHKARKHAPKKKP